MADEETFHHLTLNPSGLADEIPFCDSLNWKSIERFAPRFRATVLNRLTNFNRILVIGVIKDIEHFLDVLKDFNYNLSLLFLGDKPQCLFDRLPSCCSLQKLVVKGVLSDFEFLFGLDDLIRFSTECSVDLQIVRREFHELKFLSYFHFQTLRDEFEIEVEPTKRFKVSINQKSTQVLDLNAAINLIAKVQKSRRLFELNKRR